MSAPGSEGERSGASVGPRLDDVAVEVVRGGFVESVHRARVAITGTDGAVIGGLGSTEAPMYPRSSSKPMQAVGMLRAGLDLDGELLALAGASHDGEEFHRVGVRRILAGVGLTEDDLQNIADDPLDRTAAREWARAGHDPEPIAMNCSGKHAAMLRTSVRNGWPIDDYRDLGHPVQQAVAEAIADLTGDDPTHPTVDGCGAPLLAVSLAGLARAFGRIAAASDGPERQVADAFRGHPEWASGTRRDEAALHRGVPGVVCKAGAEAVYALGLPDGRGVAVKIADGTPRAGGVVLATALRQLGVEAEVLTEQAVTPVLGHGAPVGEVRPVHALRLLR